MASEHLAFLQSQAAHIESQVYMIEYGDIQYPNLVPIDTSAPEWAGQITYYSMDGTGQANFFGTAANDFPLVDVNRTQHNVRVENLAIGYDYHEPELNYAMMVGIPLAADKAMVARRVYEEKVDEIVLYGQSEMGWDGLLNSDSLVTNVDSPANGASNSRRWQDKDPDDVIADLNSMLTGIFVDSLHVELADTILLPTAVYTHLGTTPRSSTTDTSILAWFLAHNVYTMQTGRQPMVRAVRGLESQGTSGRAVAYAKDVTKMKFHLPMPLRFFPAQQQLLHYVVPGMFRLGGFEIRKPTAIRYMDQIA